MALGGLPLDSYIEIDSLGSQTEIRRDLCTLNLQTEETANHPPILTFSLNDALVGEFNPIWKNISQIASFRQVRRGHKEMFEKTTA